ncbi:hypothetical protein ACQ86O_27690 (plasmid) [Serratia sp. L9]|uniref:hypothetical protein n=1 Tax=Serratia sp. L9 TaxID=3423946 RepID=UPI003D66AE4A
MLYIVSDDNYFSLGAKEVLTQSGYQVAIIDTKRLLRLDTFIKLQHEDTILLSSENEDLSQITLFLAIASNVKIIHSISGNVPSDIWKKGILSKKPQYMNFLASLNIC